jgi:hypothetical protein
MEPNTVMEGTVLEVPDCTVMLQGDKDENLLGKVTEQTEKERESEKVKKLASNRTSNNHTSKAETIYEMYLTNIIETNAERDEVETTEVPKSISKPPESTPELQEKMTTGEKRKSPKTEKSSTTVINWVCYEGGDTEYFLRWSVKGDAFLRQYNKVTDKNSKLKLPKRVWKVLVLFKEDYLDEIAIAEHEYIEDDIKRKGRVLLELPENWVLFLHTYSVSDLLYVGLLKRDPTEPSLILRGLGMNFYPEDYFKLLDKLSERLEIDTTAKARKRG